MKPPIGKSQATAEYRRKRPRTGNDKYRRYLDPAVLARISSLELRARLAIEGYFAGTHRSPYRGLSVEFADHRAYAQGDDIRHIDWKVYGRTNKLYIKQYIEETNLNLIIAVDNSASMAYQSPDAPLSKYAYASSIAASLAYLALRQHDSVGLAVFSHTITQFIKPSNNPSHWKTLINELDAKPTHPKTSIRRVLDDLAERLRRRTLIILISDLFDDIDETILGLKKLRYAQHEVIVCNIWDVDELNFPFRGPTMFEGFEDLGNLTTEPQTLRDAYLQQVRTFTHKLSRRCRAMQVDFSHFDTATPLDVSISTYLANRSAGIRHRASRVLRA